ncbi:MAG TPA: BON domain-containing protein [Anaerolineae bacterium]
MLLNTDTELHHNVLAELGWDPVLNKAAIDIIITDHVVELSGRVSSEAIRRSAVDAARRVRGVKEVVNHLQVDLPTEQQPSDDELARLVTIVLQSCAILPAIGLQVSVCNGVVRLSGEVPWLNQRACAENLVSILRGVAGVVNDIAVVPGGLPDKTDLQIEAALQRCAGLDAQWVTVEAYKGKVVLRGSVRSWLEYAQAEEIASRAPGVIDVTNHLAVLF